MDLIDFKTTFDGILQEYIGGKIKQDSKIINHARTNKFVEYIQTFIFSGGKRLRPYCARAIYMWLGGKEEKAMLSFTMFFELFHSFALMHDDIMDQADKRHNAPSTHHYIQTMLDGHPNAMHTGESQAILVGDLLYSRAYELLHKDFPFAPELLKEARDNIQHMIEEVILWQMVDVDLSISPPADLEVISKKNMYKTASYTFIRPMMTGAILAGADTETRELIRQLAENLGLAFQLRDDLQDLTGWDKTKSMFMDIQEAQQTHFTYYIFNQWTDEQKALLANCLGKRLTNAQIDELKKMFEVSGALERGRKQVNDYLQKAKAIFDTIPMVNQEAKMSFAHMIKKLEK